MQYPDPKEAKGTRQALDHAGAQTADGVTRVDGPRAELFVRHIARHAAVPTRTAPADLQEEIRMFERQAAGLAPGSAVGIDAANWIGRMRDMMEYSFRPDSLPPGVQRLRADICDFRAEEKPAQIIRKRNALEENIKNFRGVVTLDAHLTAASEDAENVAIRRKSKVGLLPSYEQYAWPPQKQMSLVRGYEFKQSSMFSIGVCAALSCLFAEMVSRGGNLGEIFNVLARPALKGEIEILQSEPRFSSYYRRSSCAEEWTDFHQSVCRFMARKWPHALSDGLLEPVGHGLLSPRWREVGDFPRGFSRAIHYRLRNGAFEHAVAAADEFFFIARMLLERSESGRSGLFLIQLFGAHEPLQMPADHVVVLVLNAAKEDDYIFDSNFGLLRARSGTADRLATTLLALGANYGSAGMICMQFEEAHEPHQVARGAGIFPRPPEKKFPGRR